MKKFIYKREDDQVHLDVQGMDLVETASAVGAITQELYTTLHRQDPGAADVFKTAVILCMTHPDSPVWTEKELGEDAVQLCILGKKPK